MTLMHPQLDTKQDHSHDETKEGATEYQQDACFLGISPCTPGKSELQGHRNCENDESPSKIPVADTLPEQSLERQSEDLPQKLLGVFSAQENHLHHV